MKIGFDIMGGDYAPKEAIAGAIIAQQEMGNTARIELIGDIEEHKYFPISCTCESHRRPLQIF